jgi:hypothetical protein
MSTSTNVPSSKCRRTCYERTGVSSARCEGSKKGADDSPAVMPPVHEVEPLRAVWVCTLVCGIIGLCIAENTCQFASPEGEGQAGDRLTFHCDRGIM